MNTQNPLYWLALLLVIVMALMLMWRDRDTYICKECGKSQKLIKGSHTQNAWCDECNMTTEFVKE